MIYNVTYHRNDTNFTEKRQLKDINMVNLIKRLHKGAVNKGIAITSIVITTDGTGTYIEACDKCQSIIGVKKFECMKCRSER
jgi:hydroxymethylglutaryl-CoA reductase